MVKMYNWSLGLLQVLATQAHVVSDSHDQRPILAQGVSTKSCNYQSYTALGDSWACGFGAKQRLRLCQPGENDSTASCTTERCGKDTGGYPYLFWEQHKIATFQYLACDGNDTGSVLNSQVKSSAFGNPDLVTINVGGDDGSFFRRVAEACIQPEGYNSSKCDGEIRRAQDIIKNQGPPVSEIFNEIKRVTHNRATVVVMSYARIFYSTGDRPGICNFLKTTDLQFKGINNLATALNTMLEKAAKAAQFKYVDVDPSFENHRLCEPMPYFQVWPKKGVDTGGANYTEVASLHPTLTAIQETFLKQLNSVLGC